MDAFALYVTDRCKDRARKRDALLLIQLFAHIQLRSMSAGPPDAVGKNKRASDAEAAPATKKSRAEVVGENPDHAFKNAHYPTWVVLVWGVSFAIALGKQRHLFESGMYRFRLHFLFTRRFTCFGKRCVFIYTQVPASDATVASAFYISLLVNSHTEIYNAGLSLHLRPYSTT